MKKTYVDVLCRHRLNQNKEPIAIYFNNIKYDLDKVNFVGPRFAQSGGAGDCWEIYVNGQFRKLFYDLHEQVFFVEKE